MELLEFIKAVWRIVWRIWGGRGVRLQFLLFIFAYVALQFAQDASRDDAAVFGFFCLLFALFAPYRTVVGTYRAFSLAERYGMSDRVKVLERVQILEIQCSNIVTRPGGEMYQSCKTILERRNFFLSIADEEEMTFFGRKLMPVWAGSSLRRVRIFLDEAENGKWRVAIKVWTPLSRGLVRWGTPQGEIDGGGFAFEEIQLLKAEFENEFEDVTVMAEQHGEDQEDADITK
jgi:hypothetical protein